MVEEASLMKEMRDVSVKEHVHFIGVGGYGMSAVARIMVESGYTVSGSDMQQNELTKQLQELGVTIYQGHAAEHVNGADWVVYSSGIPSENVEMITAKEQGIPLFHRSQMLARLVNEKKGITVAGSHGKTTTSSMIAFLLTHAELDPSFLIGGNVVGLGGNARAGKSPYVVAEADESDRSFLHYHPYLSVVTNIEADHLENYGGQFSNLLAAYEQYLSQVREGGMAIISMDDLHLREMLPKLRGEVITYGRQGAGDYQAINIEEGNCSISFDLLEYGKPSGRITLPVPGKHNVSNALAAIAVGRFLGVSFSCIADAMQHFTNAKRRFQIIGDIDDCLIVDDYAHHPTEIRATLEAAKGTGRRIVAIFQPQRYTRTYYLFEQFGQAFADADEVIITDIYSPAGEKQIEGVSAKRLAELIKEKSNSHVHYVASKDEILQYLLNKDLGHHLVLTMGATDIWKVGTQLLEKRQVTHTKP